MRNRNLFFSLACILFSVLFTGSLDAQEIVALDGSGGGIDHSQKVAESIAENNAWMSIYEQMAEQGYLCCEEVEIIVLVSEAKSVFEYSEDSGSREGGVTRHYTVSEVHWKLEVVLLIPGG